MENPETFPDIEPVTARSGLLSSVVNEISKLNEETDKILEVLQKEGFTSRSRLKIVTFLEIAKKIILNLELVLGMYKGP